ncbi:MAG TPA: glycosyltransferase [Anaerolineae bacterium]|nr:glycosyltransferase [Anaerolineae bacterium]
MTNVETPLFLSVVIPCYNEARNLERGVLDEVDHFLGQQSYRWEVIVVDDGSTDTSRQLIERIIAGKAGFTLLDIPHGGKPAAVWAGIQHAQGEVVLFTDMDQSTPIGEVDKLLPGYNEGYDVVIGSRGAAREGFTLLRKLGSLIFRSLRSLFLLRNINDTQCGFKTCRRHVALETFPRLQFFKQAERPSGWKVSAYDVELLYIMEKAGYAIKEVVVEWQNRDVSVNKGQQNELVRYVNESLEMAREIFRVKRNELRGMYD